MLMLEIRSRIVWAIIGYYALSSGLEEIITRIGFDGLGYYYMLVMYNDWLNVLIERSWFFPWFLIVVGLFMILAPMFSPLDEERCKK